MPYQRSGKDAPEYVRELPAKQRRKWIAVFNDAYQRCTDENGDGCEDRAFAQANGVTMEVSMPDEIKDVEGTGATPEPAPAKEMDVASVLELLQSAMDALKAMAAPPDAEPEPEGDEPPMEEAAADFAESAAQIVRIVESEAPANRRAPLEMDVAIIAVGPGNERDNNFYAEEMLDRDGKIFEGVTMHVVDHNEGQRAERTDVSTVKEVYGVREIDAKKHLVARVLAYDPDFCEKTRNRADAGMLGKLQCSILARGESRPGKVGEGEYNIVDKITEARHVDWVSRAGAGGHALQLAESAAEPDEEPVETETQELDADAPTRPVTLSEGEHAESEVIPSLPLAEVVNVLGKTNLPAASVAELARGAYADVAEVQTAVTAEVARLKAAGSGQPVAVQVQEQKTPTTADIQRLQSQVNFRYLGGR